MSLSGARATISDVTSGRMAVPFSAMRLVLIFVSSAVPVARLIVMVLACPSRASKMMPVRSGAAF